MQKKSKVTLALLSLLAMPGYALAEGDEPAADKSKLKAIVSSVEWELYGHLYPELVYIKQAGASVAADITSTIAGPAGGNGTNHYELNTSNSRVGIRAQRAFGSGITAIAQLEYKIQHEATGTNLSARDSYLGVRGAFGTVKLGAMDTVYKNAGDTMSFLGVSSGNIVSNSNLLSKTGFGTSSASSFHLRQPNSIVYNSPRMGGAQFHAQFSPDETQNANKNSRLWSFAATYEISGLYLALGHEIHNDFFGGSRNVSTALANNTNILASSKDTATRGTIRYKFGDSQIEGNYAQIKFDESGNLANGKFQSYKHNTWSIAGQQRFGPVRAAVAYASAGAGTCALTGTAVCRTDGLKGNQISVGAAYDFPEASIFVLATRLTNGASAQYNNTEATAVAPGADVNQIAVGLSFRF